jgi:hypothetical protein
MDRAPGSRDPELAEV